MNRLVLTITVVVVSGCLGATSTAELPDPADCDDTVGDAVEGTSYPEFPRTTDEGAVTEFVTEFEKSYARQKHSLREMEGLRTTVSGVTVTDTDAGVVASIDEVQVSGHVDGDPYDLAYAVSYLIDASGVSRNESSSGAPPSPSGGTRVISCS